MLLYPLMGSSRYINVGPESSISIVTAAYVGGLAAGSPRGLQVSPRCSAWSRRASLLLGAVLRLAVVARLLSTPVLTGYLTGSAVIIGVSQLCKIFAVRTPAEQWCRRSASRTV